MSTHPRDALGREPGWIYRDLNVEPIINCAGVRTNHGGSNPCPEVLTAIAAAAEAFVDLDELAEGAGQRLAALTGAEWGMVTAGTAAALALATAACIAGNDPERMLRLPRTDGIPHRVVMPAGHRFDYDNAIQMTGAEIVTADTAAALLAALDNQAVMVAMLGRMDAASDLPLAEIAPLAQQRGVPILVDAAGLSPANPDPWLDRGADLVIYSGGKYLRAPQSTGLLLGKRRLCEAAWRNGPPHQAFGRPMKVGKEDIVGAVVALERWLTAASASAERAAWEPRLRRIARALSDVPGVTTKIQPASAAVTAPRLRVSWDESVTPVRSATLRKRLLDGRPRILIHDFWATKTSILLDPFNLTDAEVDIVASALAAALTSFEDPPPPSDETDIDVSGQWTATVDFLHGSAEHLLDLRQDGPRLTGSHRAGQSRGDIEGRLSGKTATFVARHAKPPMTVFYSFTGRFDDGSLTGRIRLGAASGEHLGPVFMEQFGEARWRAGRR